MTYDATQQIIVSGEWIFATPCQRRPSTITFVFTKLVFACRHFDTQKKNKRHNWYSSAFLMLLPFVFQFERFNLPTKHHYPLQSVSNEFCILFEIPNNLNAIESWFDKHEWKRNNVAISDGDVAREEMTTIRDIKMRFFLSK